MKISEIEISDYLIDNEEDDDLIKAVKEEVRSWPPHIQKIWLVYVETGTYAATAREFNVSPPTAKTYITTLRNKIMKKIKDIDLCM